MPGVVAIATRPARPAVATGVMARPSAGGERLALATLLLVALALRLPGLFHDLPYSYYGDELHLVRRAMAMGTGDLDPHWYNKPAGLMYALLALYALFYGICRLSGTVDSPEAFGAWFLADHGPFLLIGRTLVLAAGIGLVLATFRLARALRLDRTTALLAALAVAVLPPLSYHSVVVKEDVPSAALLVAALWLWVEGSRSGGVRPLLLAGVAAGLSAGVKYYGVLAVPVFALALLRPTPAATRVKVLVALAAFALTLFAATPFSFLRGAVFAELAGLLSSFAAGTPAWDPDNGVFFVHGLAGVPGALALVFDQLARPDVFGLALLALAAAGAVLWSRGRRGRERLPVLLLPVLGYLVLASTLWAYHPSPRHASGVYPLLAILAAGALRLLTRRMRPGGLSARHAALLAGIGVLAPALLVTAGRQLDLLRPDTRTLAARWLEAHLPPDAKVFLDDYGPVLHPSPAAIARYEARMAGLPPDDPFVVHRAEAFALMKRHPPQPAFDVEVLAHPWWSPVELSEEEIRRNPRHRRKASPIETYRPPPLSELRARGFRFVVVSEASLARYRAPDAARRYPSFARFDRELAALEPLVVFDPRELDARGPRILVYDLGQDLEPPPPRPAGARR